MDIDLAHHRARRAAAIGRRGEGEPDAVHSRGEQPRGFPNEHVAFVIA